MIVTMDSVSRAASGQRPFAFVAIGLAVLYIAAMSMWSSALPPSYWMRVRSVHVLDTVVGTSPVMQVDRSVYRPVHALWVVTVYRKQANGLFARYCLAKGWHDYDENESTPDVLDLDWWTAPTRCDLPVGEYQVKTSWYLKPTGHYGKEVHSRSNEFKVLP